MKKPELVLPGGDYKRAKIALDFGADAVYVGLNKYSLRKGEVHFNQLEIKKTINYAHSLNKKIYVTFNIFAHNKHLVNIEKDMQKISKLNPDAFIIADLGVMQIAQRVAPFVPIHVSTQANVTNIEDVRFYQKLGVKRIVLARELTLKEIIEIKKAVPKMELEVFVHGSMCISYSGRCLLSNYMTGRHANLGDCAQPCRWNYKLTQTPSTKHQITNKLQTLNSKYNIQNSICYLEEKERPGEYFEIEETNNGTNIMSSKDLCTIEYIDKITNAGVTGFKVEGRNKTEYYLASTALAYREALNLSSKNIYRAKDKKRLRIELLKNAHRGYTSGFLFDEAKKGETYEGRSPIQNWSYVGIICHSAHDAESIGKSNKIPDQVRDDKRNKDDSRLHSRLCPATAELRNEHATNNNYAVLIKNKITVGDKVEVLTPKGIFEDKIISIEDNGEMLETISPGKQNQKAIIVLSNSYPVGSMLRKKISKS